MNKTTRRGRYSGKPKSKDEMRTRKCLAYTPVNGQCKRVFTTTNRYKFICNRCASYFRLNNVGE